MGKRVKRGIEEYVIHPLKHVPLKDTRVGGNYRDHYSQSGLIVLANSIALVGQQQPGLVEKHGPKYLPVFGHRRYLASTLAYKSKWTERDWWVARVVRPLPADLRLAVQLAENECKAPVPADNLANVLWERYKPTLIRSIAEISEDEVEAIHSASNYLDIPRELRTRLPIREYAHEMGLACSTIRKAFDFQNIHATIRRMVRNKGLSYSAACALSSVRKTDQLPVLRGVRQKTEPTQIPVNRAVRDYHDDVGNERRTKNFMRAGSKTKARAGSKTKARTGSLKKLSGFLGDSTRLVCLFMGVSGFMPQVLELRANQNGKKSPREVLEESHTRISGVHDSFLKHERYRRLWGYVPKQTSIGEFVNEHREGETAGRVICEPHYIVVDVNKIDPNPLNPRGKEESFDEGELEKLTQSISEYGLLQIPALMRKGRRFRSLEGHRRMVALKRLRRGGQIEEKIGALVYPELTEDQQIMIICDSDIFERPSIDERARAMTRQFKLERKRHGKDYDVRAFCEKHPEWSPRIVRDAIAYDGLPRGVKRFYSEGLIPYKVATDLARIDDKETQIDFAITAGILRQSHKKVLASLNNDDRQSSLFGEKAMEEMKKEAVLRTLVKDLGGNMDGVGDRVVHIEGSDDLKSEFLEDTYLMRRFQKFFRTLEEAVSPI